MSKVCIKCEQNKELTEFYNISKAKDGKDYYCKSCRYENQKKPRQHNKVCTIEGCSEPFVARGFCRSHYSRLLKTGSPIPVPRVVTPCVVDDCDKPATARDMCKNHHSNWWYHNRLGKVPSFPKDEPQTYATAHYRVRAARGHPKELTCIECMNKPASSWALSVDATDLRFGSASAGRELLSAYSVNVDDYLPMCDDCHRAYDSLHGNRNFPLRPSRWAV